MALSEMVALTCARQLWAGRFGVLLGITAWLTGILTMATALVIVPRLAVRHVISTAEIESINISRASAGDRYQVLRVRITLPISPSCTRLTTALLWINDPDAPDSFFPAGATINGGAFTANADARTLDILTVIPGNIAPGDYRYRTKSVALCSWGYGFFTEVVASESDVITIHVD